MSSDFLSNLIITKVHLAVRINNPTHSHAYRKNRENWALSFKINGQTVYSADGHDYVANAQNLVLLPKGCSYQWHCTDPGECLFIEFDAIAPDSQILVFPSEDTHGILTNFLRIEKNCKLHQEACSLENIRDLYNILLLMKAQERRSYVNSSQWDRVRPAIEYIDEHYADPEISNEQLANRCSISTVYFRKLFRDCVGMSPIAYLHQIRIKRAKELLLTDYSSITQIAESVGYRSIYHFSKMFRNYTGHSPSNFTRLK